MSHAACICHWFNSIFINVSDLCSLALKYYCLHLYFIYFKDPYLIENKTVILFLNLLKQFSFEGLKFKGVIEIGTRRIYVNTD